MELQELLRQKEEIDKKIKVLECLGIIKCLMWNISLNYELCGTCSNTQSLSSLYSHNTEIEPGVIIYYIGQSVLLKFKGMEAMCDFIKKHEININKEGLIKRVRRFQAEMQKTSEYLFLLENLIHK